MKVPIRTASTAFSRRSRYQTRIVRAENVPVASCTTSTLTVTTNPVSETEAATTVVSTAWAVASE